MDETNQILRELRAAIQEYDAARAGALAERSLAEGIPQVDSLAAMTEAIREVGEAFGRGDLFLPDLIGAAKALEAALPVLRQAMIDEAERPETRGVVVLGTVLGDVHTIGKGMVSALLTANGFEVHDLGVNVATSDFIAAVRDRQARILAMSALLTSTAVQIGPVVKGLEEAGLRRQVLVAIGGGAVTAELAHALKVDAYHATAPGGVDLIVSMLEDKAEAGLA
ncbi:MAG: cobalamin-dependent protein [Thermoleophilia bacterium]|nr:cobalamin-dependent protein [Thermoleophilia bacterium]